MPDHADPNFDSSRMSPFNAQFCRHWEGLIAGALNTLPQHLARYLEHADERGLEPKEAAELALATSFQSMARDLIGDGMRLRTAQLKIALDMGVIPKLR